MARTETSSLASRTFYFHSDGNGNVTTLTDSNAAVVARYLYDPFGNVLALSGPQAAANLYRFSSKEEHPASGLVYYGYRFYDPNLQRWPNRDPIGEPGFELLRRRKYQLVKGGHNLYAFVDNSPLNNLDPLGLLVIPPGFPPEVLEECRQRANDAYNDCAKGVDCFSSQLETGLICSTPISVQPAPQLAVGASGAFSRSWHALLQRARRG